MTRLIVKGLALFVVFVLWANMALLMPDCLLSRADKRLGSILSALLAWAVVWL